MNINPLYLPFFFLLFLSQNGYCSLDVSCQPEDCSTSADITAVQYHSEESGSFLEGYLEIYSALYAKVGDTYTILLKGATRYGTGRITYQNISSDLNSGNYSIVRPGRDKLYMCWNV